MLNVDQIAERVGDFQRDYLFRLSVINYPVAINAKVPAARSILDDVDLLAREIPVPESKEKSIKLAWSGMFAWFSGPNEAAGTVAWTLSVPRSWGVADVFEAWQELRLDPSNGSALLKPLTTGLVMVQMVDLDKTTVLKAYQLQNFAVQGCDTMTFKKDGDAIQTIKINGVYEKRIPIRDSLGSV